MGSEYVLLKLFSSLLKKPIVISPDNRRERHTYKMLLRYSCYQRRNFQKNYTKVESNRLGIKNDLIFCTNITKIDSIFELKYNVFKSQSNKNISKFRPKNRFNFKIGIDLNPGLETNKRDNNNNE